jgi:hydroxyacylglutathione hydrolase
VNCVCWMHEDEAMPDVAPFSIHALELGPMENFIYLIHDHKSGRAAVVDPAWDVPEVLALAKQHGMHITDILLTHSHHDHINGINDVLQHSDAQLHLLKAEARFWGQHMELPGHTPGSACYHVGDELITGDTLFVFGCGRCDMQGGDPEQMYTTLKNMAQQLPAQTCVHPGHNYAIKPVSTMEEQVEGNPFMHFDNVEHFIRYRMHYHDQHRHTPYGPVCKGHEMPD